MTSQKQKQKVEFNKWRDELEERLALYLFTAENKIEIIEDVTWITKPPDAK